MKKHLVTVMMVLVSTSVFADKHDEKHNEKHNEKHYYDRDIHGLHFNGNINLPPVTPGSGSASDNGDHHANDNGNEHGVGHQIPSVPVPGALWLFGSALVSFLTIAGNRKNKVYKM